MITIITVVYNGLHDLENTILSVINQTYKNIEYIIIDGGSQDGTIDLIERYKLDIDIVISEPDEGIYDAMNKGISLAHGEWINFMNCGDCYATNDVLSQIFSKEIEDNIQFIYSDYFVKKGRREKMYSASYDKGILLHQSCIYRRSLHNFFGRYHKSRPIIVSDYLFFNLIPKEYYFKTDVIISVNDGNGISSGSWIIAQKYCLDYVFQRIGLMQMFYLIVTGYIKRGLLMLISKFH